MLIALRSHIIYWGGWCNCDWQRTKFIFKFNLWMWMNEGPTAEIKIMARPIMASAPVLSPVHPLRSNHKKRAMRPSSDSIRFEMIKSRFHFILRRMFSFWLTWSMVEMPCASVIVHVLSRIIRWSRYLPSHNLTDAGCALCMSVVCRGCGCRKFLCDTEIKFMH